MSRFVSDETDAIDLGDGDTVHIRRRMNYGQHRVIASLMTGQDKAVATSEYLAAILLQNIVSWTGPGFEGVAVSRQSIDSLDPNTAAQLANEIAVRNGAGDSSFTQTATASAVPSSAAVLSHALTPKSESVNGSAGPGTSS